MLFWCCSVSFCCFGFIALSICDAVCGLIRVVIFACLDCGMFDICLFIYFVFGWLCFWFDLCLCIGLCVGFCLCFGLVTISDTLGWLRFMLGLCSSANEIGFDVRFQFMILICCLLFVWVGYSLFSWWFCAWLVIAVGFGGLGYYVDEWWIVWILVGVCYYYSLVFDLNGVAGLRSFLRCLDILFSIRLWELFVVCCVLLLRIVVVCFLLLGLIT